MNDYFSKNYISPEDIDAAQIAEERNAMLRELDELHKEINILKSNNEMLKDCVVRLAMRTCGIYD